jgi:dihydroorotase
MKLLIKNAHLVDPSQSLDGVFDVLIEKKVISNITKSISDSSAKVIDAKGLHLLPGLVDLHVHFRDPGYEHKETIETGIGAALRGGFVACMPMPNTRPATDNQSIVERLLRKARENDFTILPCGSMTKGRAGKELSEMADLKAAGCVAVSDDGDSVENAILHRRALEYASMLGLVVSVHAEDKKLSKGGYINEGAVATRLGLAGIPNASEDTIVARDIELARLTGAHLHIQHISTERAVALVEQAKKEGVCVSCEVTPHHIALSEEDISGYDTNFKMNPPLRSERDRKALIKALEKGVIDIIATDHAPHQEVEKDVEFDQAPFGTIGLETALGVCLTHLYHTKLLPLSGIVTLMSINPQRIINLHDFATLKKGTSANLCLVDLEREWTVSPDSFSSKSRNSCFLGSVLKGKVVATISKGLYHTFD